MPQAHFDSCAFPADRFWLSWDPQDQAKAPCLTCWQAASQNPQPKSARCATPYMLPILKFRCNAAHCVNVTFLQVYLNGKPSTLSFGTAAYVQQVRSSSISVKSLVSCLDQVPCHEQSPCYPNVDHCKSCDCRRICWWAH